MGLIRAAENKIILSALYLGVEHKNERLLVEEIEKSLRKNANLTVFFIFDYSRAMRPRSTFVKKLSTLASLFQNRVCVSLYRMPQLEDSTFAFPSPLDEVVSV